MSLLKRKAASQNLINNMNLGGYAGKRLASNESAWVHHVLENNPNMFEAFANPESNTLAKCNWHGEFPGKILTGMAQTLRAFHNPVTLSAGNKMVQMFKSVQGVDGYLGPWSASTRFDGDKNKWDTWGHYHCIYGLYQWYKVTNNQDALDVAIKAADCVYNYFIVGKKTFASQDWAECNFAISHTFAILYQETNDRRYLEACEQIVLNEWKYEYHDFYTNKTLACDWLGAVKEGKEFYQSSQPRWEGLHTILTLSPLYQITGNEEYYHALEHLWHSIVKYDRHNFGGFGTGEGAEGKPYIGGSETCNTVAWMAMSTEFLKLSKLSYVADELELSFYNASIGSLVGDYGFTYMNPMSGERISAQIILANHGFEGGTELSCCQANGNRGLSQITEWAILSDEDSLYINYFGQYNAETKTPRGADIKILQETDYPKSGGTKIVLTLDKNEEFKLNLRIPSWSTNTAILLNGTRFDNITAGQYFVIDRMWQSGDTIEMEFDMSVHYWVGEQECEGKECAFYGPVLLAMKWPKTLTAQNISKSPADVIFHRADINAHTLIDNINCLLSLTVKVYNQQQVDDVNLVAYADAWTDGELYETWFNIV